MTSAASAFPSRPASPSSSGVPASGPVVRLRDPGELLAGVPFLLGFHPRESLVLLALGGSSGRRVGLVQRVDLPPPEHAAAVCAALAANAAPAAPAGAAVLVVGGGTGADAAGADAAGAGGGRADAGGACDAGDAGADAGGGAADAGGGAGPPHRALAAAAAAALSARGVATVVCAWAAGTRPGAAWACYGECGCDGVLPDAGATPLAATAVAAGVVVHADRAVLERLVAPVPAEVLRRRERLLARAVDSWFDGGPAGGPGGPPDRDTATALVDAALADAAAGPVHLDDGRVLALAAALADPLVRDAALARCATPAGSSGAEQLWAALARETPDPEAAEPAALLAACALLRGDGALAGIALDRAERAWPGHRLTGLLRAALLAGIRPEQLRECLRTAPLPPAARARVRRRRR